MWEQAAKKTIILVTLLAATVVTASGPAVATPSSAEASGSCLIVSSDPPAVGINPDCRPIGTGLPCDLEPQVEVRSTERYDASATFTPEFASATGLTLPADTTQITDPEMPEDPKLSTYLKATLPGPDTDLGDSVVPQAVAISPALATDTLVLRGCLV